jgi:hypothetical protein
VRDQHHVPGPHLGQQVERPARGAVDPLVAQAWPGRAGRTARRQVELHQAGFSASLVMAAM